MIAIIGRGNVATHLQRALSQKTETVIVNPHTLENLPDNPEVILISVTDSAIHEVFEKLPEGNYLLAHTAGSIPMNVIEGKTPFYGVLYPLQTFSKKMELDYSIIPIFLEYNNQATKQKLEKIAGFISNDVREADSNARTKLHLASVFACNFTNALANIANNILKDSGISFDSLLPLMAQTVKKLEYLSPEDAQTGPAQRNDTEVIKAHLKLLEKDPQIAEIYRNLTNFIQNG